MNLTCQIFSIFSQASPSTPDIFFASFSLSFSCSLEALQNLSSDHLPILKTAILSPLFHPNERLPSFNYQKARWDDFAFYFDSHCSSAEEYSSLSSAAVIFSSLALNVAKLSILFGLVNRQPQAWLSPEVVEALSKRRKIFAALIEVMKIVRLTSQLPKMPHLSSPKPRLGRGRQHAHLSLPNLILNLGILFFILWLVLLSHLPPLLPFQTVPFLGSRLRSLSTT